MRGQDRVATTTALTVCLAGWLFLIGMPCLSAEFTVDRPDDAVDAVPGDGQCMTAPEPGCSLRAAIQEANVLPGPDTVVLPAGTFPLSLEGIDEDASATGDIDITDAVSIVGAGPEETIIDAAAIDRVMDLLPADAPRDVALTDLTLRNGHFVAPSTDGLVPTGAGLRVGLHVHLDLVRVTVRDNRAEAGTPRDAVGISNRGCIFGERVRILDNFDTSVNWSIAGGVFTDGMDSCLTLVDSELRGNRGNNAGAIFVERDASVNLRRTLITDNEGGFSGAMALDQTNTALLENVTISGNHGANAILVDGNSTLTLINSTVTDNRNLPGLTTLVGGIHDVHLQDHTFISNTILSGNGPGFVADDCLGVETLDGGNIVGDSKRCNFSPLPSDQPDVDPGLEPLADNGGFTETHLPGPNAIDHGVEGPCPATDQRGVERPLDGDDDGAAHCDVGAVEQLGEPGSPSISIADRPEKELDSGLHLMLFTLTLSSASDEPVTVDFATEDGTAIAGVDYFAASGTVTFDPGETSAGIFVAIIPNTVVQDNRSFFVNLSNPGGATIEDGTAVGTIFDDDTLRGSSVPE